MDRAKLETDIFKKPSWWNRRTKLEKILTIATVIGLLVIIALFIGLICASQSSDESVGTCVTEECTFSATRILSSIDKSIEPCDDFYQFTCGNFIKSTIIPEDETQVTAFSLTNNLLNTQLYSLLNEPVENDEIFPFKLVKNYFKACMNLDQIEKIGIQPVLNAMNTLGGWPVLMGNSWNERTFNWTKTVQNLHAMGNKNSAIFSYTLTPNVKNISSRILYIDEPNLFIERENLVKGMDDDIVQAYLDFMVDIAVIFGADNSTAKRDMKDVLNFIFSLNNIKLPREERRDIHTLYNVVTLGEMNKNFTFLNWIDFFNGVLPDGVDVDAKEQIWVAVPKYFEKLGNLLRTTPKRILSNYILWTGIYSTTDYLNTEVRDREFQYNKIQSGVAIRRPRWKQCVSYTKAVMSEAIGALYVRKYFNDEDKHLAVEIVKDIRDQFSIILGEIDWMDEETRKSAFDKASVMTQHVGYPDELMNDEAIVKFYKAYDESVPVSSNTFFEMTLQLIRGYLNIAYAKLRQPYIKNEWHDHADTATVNAMYRLQENSIEFPAGVLQGQFFARNRPRYLNYPAIGFFIGHEITHGFDDEGGQYDLNGTIFEWWQNTTRKSFLEKAKCIIEQYGNITEPLTGLRLNGINTQGENIADNGGVKIAYLAYKKWLENNGPEQKIPSLGEYTSEQMFWISYARTWCATIRPETMKNRIVDDPHSPARIRVMESLKNMKYFANDFNCPVDSPMNPSKKCEFW